MPQTIWSGAIAFGLVNVPVKLVAATRDHGVHFVQLHGEDAERIRMKRTCPEHGEVPFDEVVKGYKVSPSEYVVVTQEELDTLEPEKTRTIDIEGFVELKEVDPLYFDRAYHLVPSETAGKAYRLLLEAMEASKRTALGRFVLRNREHVVAIRPYGGRLVLQVLRHADELIPVTVAHEGTAEPKKPSPREREMAKKLVDSLSMEFDPAAFKDDYRERVLELVERKAKGETITVHEPERRTPAVQDLEKALERSLQDVAGR